MIYKAKGNELLELILHSKVNPKVNISIPCIRINDYLGNIGIDIIDANGDASRINLYGYRYSILTSANTDYSLSKVQPKIEEEDGMKMEHNVIQVNLSERFGNFTAKRYDYKTEISVAIDDLVVVETQYGPALGRVCGFEKATVKCLKWVIQKVDLELVEKRAVREKALAEMKSKVTKRANEVRKHQELAFLAQTDFELASLIAQLQRLESEAI